MVLLTKTLNFSEPYKVEENKIRSLVPLQKKAAQDYEKIKEPLQIFNTSTRCIKEMIFFSCKNIRYKVHKNKMK